MQAAEAEVIIVGAGSAGLNAALTVKMAGYQPLIIEKMARVGGNSIKSSSGMNASETQAQRAAGIEDHNADFYAETLRGGKGTNDPVRLAYFVTHSAAALEWLASLGIVLDQLTLLGGMRVKRTHRPHDGSAIGGYLMHHLYDRAVALDIPIWTETRAESLLCDEHGTVRGVKVRRDGEERDLHAPVVILASGGFGANREWIGHYQPALSNYVTTNAPGNVGDGIRMAQAAGAAVVDMAEIQVHPTVHQASGFLIGEAVRGEGAILVNQEAERFVNELATRDVVSAAITQQASSTAYLIFSAEVVTQVPALQFYASRGLVTSAATLAELAEALDMPKTALTATVAAWNQAVQSGRDAAFGRLVTGGTPLQTGPFGAIPVAPGIHFTMGGVKTTTHAAVVTPTGQPLPGLFAAGEVVGGLHGKNRLGGNAIAETVVFGTRAGHSAVEYLKQCES